MFFNEKRVFITGTDTDVGKTFVSVKLLNMMREKGLNPGYFKPVATGGVFRNGNLVSEDVLTVKEQALIADDCNFINPVLYKLAAAPRIAAETEAEVIDMLKIDNAYEALCSKYESFIVEGVGALVTEDGDKPFKKGDVIYVPPFMKHSYKNTGSETLKFLCMIPNEKKEVKKTVNPFATGVANNC